MKFLHNRGNALAVIKPELGWPIALLVTTSPELPGMATFSTITGGPVCTVKIAMYIHIGNAFGTPIKLPYSEQHINSIVRGEDSASKESFFREVIKQAVVLWKSRAPSQHPEVLKANQKKWREARKLRRLEMTKDSCRKMIKMLLASKEHNYSGFEVASAVGKHFSNRRRASDRGDGKGRFLKPILSMEHLVEVFEELGQPYQLEHFETLYYRGTREDDHARAKEARAKRTEIREKLEKDGEAFVWNSNPEPAKHNG